MIPFRNNAPLRCLCLLLLCLPLLAGAELSLKTNIEPTTVRVGEPATYSVIIQGNRGRISEPTAPRVDGLDFGNASYSRRSSFGTGGASNYEMLSYKVDSLTAGTYTIPPMTLMIGDKTHITESVTFTVTGAGERSALDPFVQIEAAKTRFYVGEIIPLKLTLFAHRMAPLRHHGMPEMEREGFAMKRFPQNPTVKYDEHNGTIFQTVTFNTTFSSIKAGTSSLGPASLEILIDKPSRRSAFPSFFSTGETVRMKPVSNSIQIETLPLPEDGRPADFEGAVGSFSLSTTASPIKLRVGDPISVELTIRGRGNFEAVKSPVPTAQEGLKFYPPKTYSEPERGGTEERGVTFSQVVVPEQTITELPPYSFSFFDPDTARYITLKSDPVPLEIMPDDRYVPPPLDGAAAVATNGVQVLTPDAAPPEAQYDGILHILPEATESTSAARPPHRRALFLAANALPALGLAALLFTAIGARREKTDPDSPSAQLENGLDELGSGAIDGQTFYQLTHRSHQLAKTLAPADAPAETPPALAEALGIHAHHSYSGGANPELPPRETRAQIVRDLRQVLRGV